MRTKTQSNSLQPEFWDMMQIDNVSPINNANNALASGQPAQAGLVEAVIPNMLDIYGERKAQQNLNHALLKYNFNIPESIDGLDGPDGSNNASKSYAHLPDADYYVKLANIESGKSSNYSALNKGSGAYGKYQFMPSTLAGMSKSMNKSEDYLRTPEGQEEAVRSFTAANERGLRAAGLPVNNFTRYMAHQQGLGGAIDLLKHNKGNYKNMSSNMPAGMGVNATNFLNYWRSKFA